jgi:hypothetical protein
MTVSELDEVTALLERVLPDPAGFAERLVQQVVTQWAGVDLPPGEPVVVRGEAQARDDRVGPAIADIQQVLAAALGACDCWGLAANCPVCDGEGGSGWAEPDLELFGEFVGPALLRISAVQDASASEDGTSDDHPDDPTDGDRA